jgi:class 3 adenylate cyclase
VRAGVRTIRRGPGSAWPAPPPLTAPAAARREGRKRVSVLFCDLVGFTSRAERLDVEDDPERAVRAALAIRDAIAELNQADPSLGLGCGSG